MGVNAAVDWAEKIARDDSHGYSQAVRWAPDYDCSSFVISALEAAGLPMKAYGASYTGNMPQALKACGFTKVKGINLSTGAGLLRGEEKLDFKLIRDVVASESVVYENLGNGVAYLRIHSFADDTFTAQFLSEMSRAQQDGCTKFVFDVRNNTGGYLEEICKTLDVLLPEGPIINIVDKDGKTTSRDSDANCIKADKMVVLCNEATASAAELFTAALRDYELAESYLHPERPADLQIFFEALKAEEAIDFSTSQRRDFAVILTEILRINKNQTFSIMRGI